MKARSARRLWIGGWASALIGLASCASDAPVPSTGQAAGAVTEPELQISDAIRHDNSLPTSQLQNAAVAAESEKKEKKEHEHLKIPETTANGADPVVQGAPAAGQAPAVGIGFDAIGEGFRGVNATPYHVQWIPSDQNIAVGPSEIVEVTNDQIAVFDKSGTPTFGPKGVNVVWSGFGGRCESTNDGDPVVRYDRFAGRWIVTQFQVTTAPYSQCVAVSSTSSFVGSTWSRYEFNYQSFNDYPKLSVWHDAYYITYNIFSGSFRGGAVCALERDKMLIGAPARQICYQFSSKFGGLLAADVDGPTLPTHDELVLNFKVKGGYALNVWKFHPNWTTPASSTLTAQPGVPIAAFSTPSGIAQLGTSQRLDALGDRLMFRLAYRKLGAASPVCAAPGTASMVVNHTVSSGGVAGVRWYELRVTDTGAVALCQQATFKPDSTSRWMGSIAGDKQGNLAVGYSASSSSIYPGIRMTGRLAADAAGTMGAETTIQQGGGYQQAGRWGDYTSMVIDPTDDCTFWYANQYEKSTGAWNWTTHVASFKFPGCL